MKTKCLSAILTLCLLGTFSGMLNCACPTSDCSSASQNIRTEPLRCHPAVPQEEKKDPSSEDCCRKCGFEKAAVLSSKFSLTSHAPSHNDLAEIRSFADLHARIHSAIFSPGKFFGSSSDFFERYILGTTFSFRAPPQAYAL
jgi:hypothetical protein